MELTLEDAACDLIDLHDAYYAARSDDALRAYRQAAVEFIRASGGRVTLARDLVISVNPGWQRFVDSGTLLDSAEHFINVTPF